MDVDVNTLKDAAYKNFFSEILKNTEYIILSMIETLPCFTWEAATLPTHINFHDINIFESEQLFCFKNHYFDVFSTFNLYRSVKEFLDLNNVYRLMFVANNEVIVSCMYDEIIIYNEKQQVESANPKGDIS